MDWSRLGFFSLPTQGTALTKSSHWTKPASLPKLSTDFHVYCCAARYGFWRVRYVMFQDFEGSLAFHPLLLLNNPDLQLFQNTLANIKTRMGSTALRSGRRHAARGRSVWIVTRMRSQKASLWISGTTLMLSIGSAVPFEPVNYVYHSPPASSLPASSVDYRTLGLSTVLLRNSRELADFELLSAR